jgi:high-affinity nickel permease
MFTCKTALQGEPEPMWSQEIREAFSRCIALLESMFIEIIEVVEGFISAYRFYILIGLILLAIWVILDLVMKWREKREKKRIDAEIEEQMKEKGMDSNSGESP